MHLPSSTKQALISFDSFFEVGYILKKDKFRLAFPCGWDMYVLSS